MYQIYPSPEAGIQGALIESDNMPFIYWCQPEIFMYVKNKCAHIAYIQNL